MNSAYEKTLKILIVEDEALFDVLLQRMLAKSSLPIAQIESAKSLDAAFKLLDNSQFDVVLLDLNLPDSSGLDTLVRTSQQYPNVAIVVVTGSDDEEVGLEQIARYAQEYLVKGTFNLETLDKCVRYAVERKHANRKLQLAEEKYRAIFENSAVAIMVADEKERLVSWNRFTESFLGMTREDLYLRPVKNFYPVEEWRKIRAYNVRQKGMQHHIETRMIKKDGTIIDVDISLSVLKNSEGRMTDSIGIVRDITERKQIQEILDRKQKNLEAIFDAAPVGMLLIDENGVVKRVNDVIRQIVHRRQYSQIVNQPAGDALSCINSSYSEKGCGYSPACPACPFRKVIQIVLDSEKSFRGVEIQLTLEVDNSRITPWFGISAEPVVIDGRKHVVVAISDITSHKEAEKKLQETMEMKSQFVSTVSHELRTPLAAMKEGVAIVLEGVAGRVNEKQKKFLDIAKRNADRLGALINDVLDFQKLEADRTELDIQNNDIGKVACEVQETMALCAKQKAVELSFELAEDVPQAKFDYSKMVQVLMNLVGNAIKFTPEKGRVSVNIQHGNGELFIRVSDTGMGIPKEALSKIFERFYRVSRPSTQIQGTGLGLAIVKKIIMMHGGRIDVESEVDHGTTFAVSLPLAAKSTRKVPHRELDEFLEDNIVNKQTCIE